MAKIDGINVQKWRCNENRGFASVNNLGASLEDTPYLLFLNQDIVGIRSRTEGTVNRGRDDLLALRDDDADRRKCGTKGWRVDHRDSET